ncbi:bifunctional folylpolyglutamate synthase/dihydrofolate synthase [Microbacterium azadirachtae]|uniref:bifunctional folylpolyglutamate synthase/dihydrofolate synthase n=1 Tax=Microbacterium azadirachtae TaxID=582680 RepID=UPI0008892BDE|nr:folylpolyglutamate synthase/dihydrofolate synthase family protein [Microbacterium azadirachtae]SDL17701.1 dihydrofolate synthase / folylpolyglutamate synthase [Microbacterium azadirachtae]SEF47888.1 dihydrofolate synthase / folylpolyglutamate synthase [Microbacterium azadirachtae]SEF47907.1 dihydrofolate synthase / folylpolyglutamate synthase [Microbacterium azadirachtae]
MSDDRERADAVYAALLERAGERWVQPRKERTARLLELLDDPQKTYRVVHLTGTNGKTSTARMIESLLRAHGLRTGLFTSPHLERFTERIMIDGEPIADAAVADAWEEIEPFVGIVDAELDAAGDAPLTFFELLTVLAFVACADAPVDVLVLEVGMGGSWDSTNTADGDVAVFTPIDLDHADRLGDTIEKIAEVKAGIIKDGAAVVSSRQAPEAEAVLRRAAAERDASIAFEGQDFALVEQRLAVGGQQITVRGLAGEYREEYLPLYGEHQGFNAALAIAAVESLIGGAQRAIVGDVLAEGLQGATSPGRLQLLGVAPTVIVDAAHNPHGARALAAALKDSFDFDEWGLVLGVLGDKDAAGIVQTLLPAVEHVFATAPDSDRASDPDALADLVERAGGRATVHPALAEAADAAREWAASADRRAVIIAGSVVLAGEAIALAEDEDWKSGWRA